MNGIGGRMYQSPIPGVLIGFAVFCVGGVPRAYMDFAASGMKMFSDFRGGNTEVNYGRLVKQRRVRAWPFYVCVVCVPLGIVIVFGSILWSNHLKH
jgi:hypothetical protein